MIDCGTYAPCLIIAAGVEKSLLVIAALMVVTACARLLSRY